ncbi:MAG: hypothetical protein LBR61_00450 [Synergistaceae bacterium]|jgi:ethanolamine utilization cobalamin adenosyltransferase|nr:hypothetical protein [Synergistaceae bacterium]
MEKQNTETQKSAKQEHTTHLAAGSLVSKADSRIEFRGRLDSLCALVVELQIRFLKNGCPEAAEELEAVRLRLVDLLICDVTEKPCEKADLWGFSAEELHKRSHYPEKYYGIGHIRPHFSMGDTASGLNLLRTQVREAEVAACRAFETGSGVERPDIVEFLNRLSSALYVLTYKYLPKGYDKIVQF